MQIRSRWIVFGITSAVILSAVFQAKPSIELFLAARRAEMAITPYQVTALAPDRGMVQVRALRADGAFAVLLHDRGDLRRPALRSRIVETPRGEVFEIDDLSHRFIRREMSPRVLLARRKDPSMECATTYRRFPLDEGKVIARSTVAGTDAVRVETPLGRREWLAPKASCALLESELTSPTSSSSPGTRPRRVMRDLVVLRIGEPDASLFAIPTTYVEQLPAGPINIRGNGLF